MGFNTKEDIKVVMLKGEKGDGVEYMEVKISEFETEVDTLSGRVDELVSSTNTLETMKTLWTGTAVYKDDLITLSDPCTDYDFIDFYYEGFDAGIKTFDPTKMADSTGFTIPVASVDVTPNASSYSPARLDTAKISIKSINNSTTNFKVESDMYWTWAGGASAESTANPVTNGGTGVGYFIYKVVGRKITNNAEVSDIRTGADGTTYPTAGDAVRGQITQLNNDLGNISSLTTENKDSVVDAINEVDAETTSLEANKANIDGYYEELTAGLAENLISNVRETEKAPYLFRPSGGSLEIGSRETDTLNGLSLVWNQLIINENQSASFTVNTNNYYSSQQKGYVGKANHVYFVSADFTYTGSLTVVQPFFQMVASSVFARFSALTSGVKKRCSALVKATTNETSLSVIGISTRDSTVKFLDGDTASYENFMACDITTVFGATIADYIYSLEQSQAGSGAEWFRKYFPADSYDYDAGEIMSAKASAHEMIGFNQWDEDWETGTYGINNGNLTKVSGYPTIVRSKNVIKVFPNTTYVFACNSQTYNAGFYVWESEGVGKTVTKSQSTSSGRIMFFTTSAVAKSLVFATRSGYGSTYKNDLCVSFRYDGERDGDYEAYVKHTYALDDDLELRGIIKLDANNELYADGDIYESNGTVTRKYEYRDYATGDEDLPDAITDGTHTVSKLATPTTESADAYSNPQIVDNWGTERYVDTRDVPIPMGHTTDYPINIKAKVEVAPDAPEADGVYLMQRLNGENSYVALTAELINSILGE